MVGLSRDAWLRIEVEVAAPLLFGCAEGFERRCVPILGGTVRGRASGIVLPGGTDWQRILPGGTSELEAHYSIRTDAGEMIEVMSRGVRSGSAETMRALLAGEPVDPALVYFRTGVRLMTAAPALRDLTTRMFIGVGTREPARVMIDLHAVE
ncbi:MAG: hypothetical protein JWM38_1285 [Sphingomonas bacterium]|nr:hypothetical protein [Sphingomonas bacterium]MDB5717858.1 hypothetical protein [Sphingomonas bacterium]